MNNRKKIVSLILSVLLLLSVFHTVPFTVSAAEIDASALSSIPDEVNQDMKIGEIKHFSSDSSIWYRFVPKEDMIILFTTVGEYDREAPYLDVYNDSFELIVSGYYSTSCFVAAGKTYYLNTHSDISFPNLECQLLLQQYCGEIEIGEKKTAYIENGGDVAYFKFTPVKDMAVSFSSNSDDDTYGYVYDEGMNQLAEDDESGNGSNFNVNARVTAGVTYIFGSKFYSSSTTGSFEVTLQEPPVWEYEQLNNEEVRITHYNGSEQDVVIPSEIDGYTVTSLGGKAFTGNKDIVSIEMPDSIDDLGNAYYSYGVFGICSELKNVKLSNALTRIPKGTFTECRKLEKVVLPDGITTIGGWAFEYCENLESINLPNGLITIDDGAFAGCSKLSNIIIPNSTEKIGSCAFESCKGAITVGYGVTEIGYKAFGYTYLDNDKMENITLKGYTGSEAETYAIENEITFVSIGQAPPKPTLSFTPMYSYEYIENVNGYWETDDFDNNKKSFVYYAPWFNDGDKLSIDYHDERGTVDYYYTSNMFECFEDEDGNTLYLSDIKRSQGHGWTVGGENTFTLTYKNMSTEVPVSVVKPEDASIRFIPKKPYELIENREGYMDGGYFWYYGPDLVKGDKLIIDYGDKSVTYIYGSKPDGSFDNKNAFYDEDGNSIPYRMSTDQDNKHFTLGSDNYFIITAAGKTAIIPVTVIEYPVESIEFKLASPIVMYENQDGYYYMSDGENRHRLQVDENGYYYYDYSKGEREKIYTEPQGFYYTQVPLYKDGNQLIIHNKDGSTKTLTQRFIFTEEDNGYIFVDENGDYDRNVSFDWDGTSFKLGSDNLINVKYLDTATTVPVTVVENNIESIEYQPVKPIVYNLDDPKDVYIGPEYGPNLSLYNPQKIHETGTVLTAHFKDGTTRKYTFYSILNIRDGKYNPVFGSRYYAVDEKGSVIGYSSLTFDYNTSDWTPGNTYYMTVGYLGATTQVPITIVSKTAEDPVIGDADGDGVITPMDVTRVQQYLSTMTTDVDEESMMYADVDKNGRIESIDTTWILRYLAGMEIPYTIGQA